MSEIYLLYPCDCYCCYCSCYTVYTTKTKGFQGCNTSRKLRGTTFYGGFPEEDRQLAEEGIADYTNGLAKEDK